MYILLIVLYVAAGVAAGWAARRKGYSDWFWTGLAILLGPITLFAFWVLPTRYLRRGTVVRAVSAIALENGQKIPAGHVSVVRETTVIDQHVVCRISAPDASHHWVAQEALSRVGTASAV